MQRPRKQIYWVWAEMLSRCRNQNHRQFKDYGARGISVCARWAGSFAAFERDMGQRPIGWTLDRIDNSKGYEPENCRWADRKIQNSNRRSCILIPDGAEVVTLKEYCRRHGLTYRPVVKRIQDRHWPLEMALTVPLGSGKQFRRVPDDVSPILNKRPDWLKGRPV